MWTTVVAITVLLFKNEIKKQGDRTNDYFPLPQEISSCQVMENTVLLGCCSQPRVYSNQQIKPGISKLNTETPYSQGSQSPVGWDVGKDNSFPEPCLFQVFG